MMFRVGQKVVFIGPDLRRNPRVLYFRLNVPIPREVYTIRSFAERVEGAGYLLNEIVNEECYCPGNGICEIAVDAAWLRPLVERKTDISVFDEILRKASKRVSV